MFGAIEVRFLQHEYRRNRLGSLFAHCGLKKDEYGAMAG